MVTYEVEGLYLNKYNSDIVESYDVLGVYESEEDALIDINSESAYKQEYDCISISSFDENDNIIETNDYVWSIYLLINGVWCYYQQFYYYKEALEKFSECYRTSVLEVKLTISEHR